MGRSAQTLGEQMKEGKKELELKLRWLTSAADTARSQISAIERHLCYGKSPPLQRLASRKRVELAQLEGQIKAMQQLLGQTSTKARPPDVTLGIEAPKEGEKGIVGSRLTQAIREQNRFLDTQPVVKFGNEQEPVMHYGGHLRFLRTFYHSRN